MIYHKQKNAILTHNFTAKILIQPNLSLKKWHFFYTKCNFVSNNVASIILFDTNKHNLPFLNFLWLSTNLPRKKSTAIKIQIYIFFEKKPYIRNKSIIFLQMLVIKFNLTLTTFIMWHFGAKQKSQTSSGFPNGFCSNTFSSKFWTLRVLCIFFVKQKLFPYP